MSKLSEFLKTPLATKSAKMGESIQLGQFLHKMEDLFFENNLLDATNRMEKESIKSDLN